MRVIDRIRDVLQASKRPILLIGGGVSREAVNAVYTRFEDFGVPVMTTWNGMDRIGSDHPLYFGRPNTFGMRYSNLLIQQADCIIALGTRLGLQQTGFNWQEFAPLAKIIQVDMDKAELQKGHPKIHKGFSVNANHILDDLLRIYNANGYHLWIEYCREVKEALSPFEENETPEGWVNPYKFVKWLSDSCKSDDIIVPCSSGNAFTCMMQAFEQKKGQIVITNKGLASMGYGLAGAIGAAFTGRRTILVEGDGGFAQNLQELGTVAINQLPIKIFIFDNDGYASIRSTQKNYFNGHYVGCDQKTALGLPDWFKLFKMYGIAVQAGCDDFGMRDNAPRAFILPISREQTFYPKISSRLLPDGKMKSNPLHLMTPELSPEQFKKYGKYLCKL